MNTRNLLSFAFSLILAASVAAEVPQVPFHKGVNLTGWFQPDEVGRLPFSRFGAQDFRNLSVLGVDGIRLPVNVAALVGPGPQYKIDPRAFDLLDQAVDGALSSGFSLVLDNHSDPLDPRISRDLEGFLKAVWAQLAAHYSDRSLNLLFEIQNEPHKISASDWAQIQLRVLNVIRAADSRHTVVVTGADWGSVKAMTELPRYADKNLLYTFHDYDPFVFTHQGAGWTDLVGLSGVAFPPQGRNFPSAAASLKPDWVGRDVRTYYSADPVPGLARTLDVAAGFSRDRGVPIWCGEFGVYNAKSDPGDRVAWYRTMRGLLEARGIPWTMWDYKDSFGLFQKSSAEVFDQDLNLPLVEALGFHAPPQSPRIATHEQTGFFLYRDSWEGGSHEAGYNHKGTVNYFDSDQPHEGKYSIKVSGVERYGTLGWTFAPWKDLTALVDRGTVALWMRSSGSKFSVDLRFVDGSQPDQSGLPWRITKTIDPSMVPGDRQWHRVQFPLKSMKETGAWDGKWHEPQPGSFAWDKVASMEIVAEQGDLAGVEVGFDEIQIQAGEGP